MDELTPGVGRRRGGMRHARIYIFLAKVFVAGVALLLLARKISVGLIVASLGALSPPSLLLLTVLCLAWCVVHFAKWLALLRFTNVPITSWEAVGSFCRGSILGAVTPLQVGELARTLDIETGYKRLATVLTFADKSLDLIALAIIAGVAWPVLGGSAWWGAAAGTALLAGVAGASYMRSWVERAVSRRIRADMPGAGLSWTDGVLAPQRVAALLGLSLAGYIIVIIQYAVVLGAMSPGYHRAALSATPLLMLARAAPLTFGGLGLREHLAATVFPRFGVEPSAAVAASLLMFTINAWIPLGIALWSLRRV